MGELSEVLKGGLTLHIREGCLKEVRPNVVLQDKQNWPGKDLAGDVAVAGPPEVRILKNPSLPRAATGNCLEWYSRGRAWMVWVHYLAKLSGPTSGKIVSVDQQGENAPMPSLSPFNSWVISLLHFSGLGPIAPDSGM